MSSVVERILHWRDDAALLCDDDTRLQRAVPYLVTQIGDASAVVRCAALRLPAAPLAPSVAGEQAGPVSFESRVCRDGR